MRQLLTKMNWVGGARSRVKQNGEKKIQKEYFERKKLANKVQRIRPSLSKVKVSVSQDLLFLKATVLNTNNTKPTSPPRIPPKALSLEPGKDRLSRRPQRDLELPMSPIGKPSNLDIMDTTTCSMHLSGKRKTQDMSLLMGDYQEPPRVSTQKIPHRTILDSFGPPKINELESKRGILPSCEPCTVPSLDHPHLNMSTMTESLFPPPAKKHKKNNFAEKDHSKKLNQLNHHKAKKYCLDDILNQHYKVPRQSSPSTNRTVYNPEHILEKPRMLHQKIDPPEQQRQQTWDAWKEHNSMFMFAKGGRKLEAGVPHNKNPKKKGTFTNDFRRFGTDVASNNAVLELHYNDDADDGGECSTVKEISNQLVPYNGVREELRRRVDAGNGMPECFRTDSKTPHHHKNTLPWETCSKSVSSLFSEDPFSRKKMPRAFVGPPVSTSVDFNESIFGPLRHKPNHNETKDENVMKQRQFSYKCQDTKRSSNNLGTVGPVPQADDERHRGIYSTENERNSHSLNTTRFNESILGPIIQARGDKRQGRSNDGYGSTRSGNSLNTTQFNESIFGPILETRRTEFDVVDRHNPLNSSNAGGKKVSTFQMMMESLEKSVKQDLEPADLYDSKQCCGLKDDEMVRSSDLACPSNNIMSNHYNDVSLPDSCLVPALPTKEASNDPIQMKESYICHKSAFHELMCLEEEIKARYEDDLLSQYNPPGGIENSEDPLFNRCSPSDQDKNSKCPFDSSQESGINGDNQKIKNNIFSDDAFPASDGQSRLPIDLEMEPVLSSKVFPIKGDLICSLSQSSQENKSVVIPTQTSEGYTPVVASPQSLVPTSSAQMLEVDLPVIASAQGKGGTSTQTKATQSEVIASTQTKVVASTQTKMVASTQTEATQTEVVASTQTEVVASTQTKMVASTQTEATQTEVVASTQTEATQTEVVASTQTKMVASTQTEVVASTQTEVVASTQTEVVASTQIGVAVATQTELCNKLTISTPTRVVAGTQTEQWTVTPTRVIMATQTELCNKSTETRVTASTQTEQCDELTTSTLTRVVATNESTQTTDNHGVSTSAQTVQVCKDASTQIHGLEEHRTTVTKEKRDVVFFSKGVQTHSTLCLSQDHSVTKQTNISSKVRGYIHGADIPSLVTGHRADTVTAMLKEENTKLKNDIEKLEERLALAENTVLWQSVMIKLWQVDNGESF